MSALDQAITTLTSLDRKKFNLYLGIVLGMVTLMAAGVVYWMYQKRSAQIQELATLHEQTKKIDRIVENSDYVSAEEERIQGLLEENKGFSIKTYFEQFCREHEVTPEQGWDTESRSLEGNEAFDEVMLSAMFKNQTTQSLVTLLTSLNYNEIVYIKELEVKNEGNRAISFTLTIATKKRKQFWED